MSESQRSLPACLSLIALNIFLFSPVLFSLLIASEGSGLHDPVVLWNVLCSAAFLITIQLLIRRSLLLHLLLLPLYVTVCVDLFIIYFYQTRLSAGYIWIIFANTDDWYEYLQSYAPYIIGAAVAFFLIYGGALYTIRRCVLPSWRVLQVGALCGLLVVYGGVIVRQKVVHHHPTYIEALKETLSMDNSSPLGVLSQSTVVFEALTNYREPMKRRDFKFSANRKAPHNNAEVYVLVLGESARTDRWSLFGYQRDTTPLLNKQDNLIPFRSLAACPITLMSIPIMLTQASLENFNRSNQEKSIVSLFSQVGFKTYWHSTQVFGNAAGNIHFITADAEEIRYYKRSLDGALLSGLDELIHNIKKENQKALVVLHTEGSHLKYKNKYPREFAIYPDHSEISHRERMQNSYDNTVIYTDYVLSGVIDRLRKSRLPSLMLYASDHGENLLDDKRNLLGHAYGNSYDMKVPMFVWYSDGYKSQYPEKISTAQKNQQKKIDAHHIFYSLADAADIQLTQPRHDLSLFNPNVKEVHWSEQLELERREKCQPTNATLRNF